MTISTRWVPPLLLAAVGCSEAPADEQPPPVDLGPVVCHPGYYTAEDQEITLLADGDPVVLRYALQGGHVIWVGARVSGLAPGPARIDSKLIDPETSEVLVHDWRTIPMAEAPDGSGELVPDSTDSVSFSHLLACPNYGTRPVEGVEWILKVEIADPKDLSRTASASVRVIPVCAQGSRHENCVCECSPGYTFLKCGAPT